MIKAGGKVSVNGSVQARGGEGGDGSFLGYAGGGGGGAGGTIKVTAPAVEYTGAETQHFDVTGGKGGQCKPGGGDCKSAGNGGNGGNGQVLLNP